MLLKGHLDWRTHALNVHIRLYALVVPQHVHLPSNKLRKRHLIQTLYDEHSMVQILQCFAPILIEQCSQLSECF